MVVRIINLFDVLIIEMKNFESLNNICVTFPGDCAYTEWSEAWIENQRWIGIWSGNFCFIGRQKLCCRKIRNKGLYLNIAVF